MENTILTLMAHPDDAEILCGGTLAHLATAGWKVHIASASPGDCGSATHTPDEIAAIRRKEGAQGAAVLDGEFHCLECRDLQIFYDRETTRAACDLLRRVRPRLVITHYPSDYMLDHEQISLVARAAAFNAPIRNAPASPDTMPLESIPHLYYVDPVEGKTPLGEPIRPGLVVDVSPTLERKLKALAAHASQREWLRHHHGMDEYLESARRWSRSRGAEFGFKYAEGFCQHRGHAYPQDDALGDALDAAGATCKRIV